MHLPPLPPVGFGIDDNSLELCNARRTKREAPPSITSSTIPELYIVAERSRFSSFMTRFTIGFFPLLAGRQEQQQTVEMSELVPAKLRVGISEINKKPRLHISTTQ